MAEANKSSSDVLVLMEGYLSKRQRGRSVKKESQRKKLKFETRYCILTRNEFTYSKKEKVCNLSTCVRNQSSHACTSFSVETVASFSCVYTIICPLIYMREHHAQSKPRGTLQADKIKLVERVKDDTFRGQKVDFCFQVRPFILTFVAACEDL